MQSPSSVHSVVGRSSRPAAEYEGNATMSTPSTAADTAYDWILRYVAALPWDEDVFLNEESLAQQAKVSRTPVREALLRLEVDGLIRRVPYRGTYVPAMSQRDIDSIFEARGLIEDWSVHRAIELRSDCEPLFRLIDEQRAVRDDPVAFNSLDLRFHGFIVGTGQNAILNELYRTLRNRQLRLGVWAVLIRENRTSKVIDEHLAIATAVHDGDLDAAVAAVRSHLASTISAIRSGVVGAPYQDADRSSRAAT